MPTCWRLFLSHRFRGTMFRMEQCLKCGLPHHAGKTGARSSYAGDGVCPLCRLALDGTGRWCKRCKAQWSRGHRLRHSEMSETQRRKAVARAYANVYLKRGKLTKQPCESCGVEKAEMHHDDYSKPIDIRWLCRACHVAHHTSPRSAPKPTPTECRCPACLRVSSADP